MRQFRKDGTYLRGFGKKGTGPGEFGTPHGLAPDRAGHRYVVGTLNGRIQVFGA